MTLPASGPISIQDVCIEYGVPTNTPFPNGFYGKPGFPNAGPWSLDQCHGLSNVVYNPPGATAAGSGIGNATCKVTCNQAAVWTYSGGGAGGSVDIASGATATEINFSVIGPVSGTRTVVWTLHAEALGVVHDWTVTVDAQGTG